MLSIPQIPMKNVPVPDILPDLPISQIPVPDIPLPDLPVPLPDVSLPDLPDVSLSGLPVPPPGSRVYSKVGYIPSGRASSAITEGAIVLEGGAWRVIYTQGALDALMMDDINFRITIGVSGGAMSGICYLAGQIGTSARLNLTYRHDTNYCGAGAMVRDHGITGFSYFFNELAPEAHVDYQRLYNPSRAFYVTATDCTNGRDHYFEKSDNVDFEQAIRASATVPYVSLPVRIEGTPYLDGGLDCHIPYKKAFHLGCKKVMVIKTRDRGFRADPESDATQRLIETMYGRTYPLLAEAMSSNHLRYNQLLDELDADEAAGRVFVLAPSEPVTVSRFEGDVEKLGELYWLGYNDMVRELPRLRAYLAAE